MKEIIRVADVTKTYRNGRGIRDIRLSMFRGEIHVLLGANGAGKSTLMRIIAGLTASDSGEVLFFSRDEGGMAGIPSQEGTGTGNLRSRLYCGGYLIEQPEPFGYLSAMENLMQKGSYYKDGKESAERALARTGLAGYRNEKARTFSTGMKQRLGIAMALTGNPSYLVLDEPTNGMDIAGRADMHDLLEALREEGVSILLSTHLVHEAEQIADRITVIHEGAILESGTRQDLLGQAENLEKWYLGRIREGAGMKEAAV